MHVEQRPVGELRPHEQNARIYGDSADQELVESVREHGIYTPLHVTFDGRVISGHRRLDAAQRVGLAVVPIIVRPATDEFDILEMLIHENRQREKTAEQKAREAQAIWGIERERALRRKAEAGQSASPGHPTVDKDMKHVSYLSSEAGTTRDRVGEKLGLSGITTERLRTAIEVVDHLEATGHEAEANRIKDTLNHKSIRAGYAMALAAKRGVIAPAHAGESTGTTDSLANSQEEEQCSRENHEPQAPFEQLSPLTKGPKKWTEAFTLLERALVSMDRAGQKQQAIKQAGTMTNQIRLEQAKKALTHLQEWVSLAEQMGIKVLAPSSQPTSGVAMTSISLPSAKTM